MYPIVVIIAAAVVAFSGCVQPCPSERVWMLDPYMHSMGMIAPLVIDKGDLNDPENFYTDQEFAEFLGITVEELEQKHHKAKEEIPSMKGTI